MIRDFRFTRDFVLYELPLAEGIAFENWTRENDPWLNIERSGPGYLAQEKQRRMNQEK